MKHKAGVIFVNLFLAVFVLTIVQGCAGRSKKCGCGTDLNAVYKFRKRRN